MYPGMYDPGMFGDYGGMYDENGNRIEDKDKDNEELKK
jgi:hypothetical protein